MSLKMILLIAVPMFIICCAILLKYRNRFRKPPKPRENHKKKIFISADCWLCVFDLLPASQLGLGIAMISHRFNFYVSEHFKTRKRTLALIRIHSKIWENGTKELEIFNPYWKSLPIPQIQLPRKISGFECIEIFFIDQNVIAFLHRFSHLFAKCPINLAIRTDSDHILEFILRNIWPMIAKNLHGIELSVQFFRRLQHFVPSILDDCPSLRVIDAYYSGFFTKFPANDSATASDGQALAKWLFTPLQNNVPKVLKCYLDKDAAILVSRIEAFKAAFASASSPVNFIAFFWFPPPFADFVVPFVMINELTREQLALKITDYYYYRNRFMLIRCPIARDESKWTKWEEEAIDWEINESWNQNGIRIYNKSKFGKWLST